MTDICSTLTTQQSLDALPQVVSAKEFVHLNVAAQPKASVFLTGYSRGGAGVIAVAQRLARDGVKVSAMMLFDAVDRAIGIDSTVIPNNVERVVHAKRDPNSFTRNSFGNCGTRWHAPTRCDVRCFRGTHGAIGGVPWSLPKGAKSNDYIKEVGEATPTLITYGEDKLAAQEVWRWVEPRLRVHGFFGAMPSVPGTKVS